MIDLYFTLKNQNEIWPLQEFSPFPRHKALLLLSILLCHTSPVENIRLWLVRRVTEMGKKIFSKFSKVECYPFSQENQGHLRYWWEKAKENHSFQWRALVAVSEAGQKGDQVCELTALPSGQKVLLTSSLLLRMGSSKHVGLGVQWKVDLRGLLRERFFIFLSFFFLIPEPRATAWWGTWCWRLCAALAGDRHYMRLWLWPKFVT